MSGQSLYDHTEATERIEIKCRSGVYEAMGLVPDEFRADSLNNLGEN